MIKYDDYFLKYVHKILESSNIQISKNDDCWILEENDVYYRVEYNHTKKREFGGITSKLTTLYIDKKDYNNYLRKNKLLNIVKV